MKKHTFEKKHWKIGTRVLNSRDVWEIISFQTPEKCTICLLDSNGNYTANTANDMRINWFMGKELVNGYIENEENPTHIIVSKDSMEILGWITREGIEKALGIIDEPIRIFSVKEAILSVKTEEI